MLISAIGASELTIIICGIVAAVLVVAAIIVSVVSGRGKKNDAPSDGSAEEPSPEPAAEEPAPKPKRTRTAKPKTETAEGEAKPRPKRKSAQKAAPKTQEIESRETVTAAEVTNIADEAAVRVIKRERVTGGRKRDGLRSVINVDTLSQNFAAGDEVTLSVLIEKKLVPASTTFVKVLARGRIDKPLKVHADDFSLDAVKMIAVTGGEAITPDKNGGNG